MSTFLRIGHLKRASCRMSVRFNATSPGVCVTGITGYVGSELVTQLLDRGYTVHGTVRRISDARKLDFVMSLKEKYPNKLHIYEADILNEDELVHAMDNDISTVFHTAAPFHTSRQAQEELYAPAVYGTQNVLGALRRCHTDEAVKVIFTSSIGAVRSGALSKPSNGKWFTKDDWNRESQLDMDGLEPYLHSKTMAELVGTSIADSYGFPSAVINPGFIVGPPRSQRTTGTSILYMKLWLEMGYNDFAGNYVDVRDVALAHILAAESPSASGRYICCSEHVIYPAFVAKALRAEEKLRDLVPDIDGELTGPKTFDCYSDLKSLGLEELRPLENSFREMAMCVYNFP